MQKIAAVGERTAAALDLSFELAEGFGAIGEGGASRDGTDAIVGLTFSVPLERRQARGKHRPGEAELESLRQEQRRLEDQVEIELRNILLELDIALQLMELAQQDVELSETMRRAEIGASSRAPATSSSSISARRPRPMRGCATPPTRTRRRAFDAATLNLARLGIDDSP
jgi:hypothetical protein